MLIKMKIAQLRDAIAQASYTLDSKASSVGSWLHFIARAKTDTNDARLYLYSTNLGLARTFLKAPAEVTKEGEALIRPKLLQSIIASLPGEDDIELGLSSSGAKLQVKYGSIKSEIAVHADAPKAAEVLKTIPFNAKSSVSVSAATLVELIDRTLFCAASNEGAVSEGPWLSSIRLETRNGLVLGTATNRIIAGQAEISDGLATGAYTCGLHRGTALALKALLSKRKEEEVTITNVPNAEGNTNETLFRVSDVMLFARQLSKPYPSAVSKIFSTPDSFKSARVDRKILLSVFARLMGFAEQNTFTVTLVGDKLTLITKGYSSIFQEQVASVDKLEGTSTIGLGIADFVNSLSAMKSEEVVLKYDKAKDHVHLQEGESNFKYVLSPVTVEWEKKVNKEGK